MKIITTYMGSDDPFEGDHAIWLRGLPLGARATAVTVKVTSVPATGGTLFQETIGNFDGGGHGDLNATKIANIDFVEVDFHTRRTLAGVTGSDLAGASVQVDAGGTFIDVNQRGAVGGSINDYLTLSDDTCNSLPGLAVNKLRLTRTGASPNVSTLTIRSVPSNLMVRLGQSPPFWVRVGELATADTSPNIAETLNAFLLTAPSENGFYQIPFVIHSDTLARLDVELDIDYVIEKAVLPPHLPEIMLPYNFSTLPGVDEKLTTVALPRQAVPVTGKSTAQVRGEFQPTRVRKGDIGEEPKIFPVRVAPDFSLAQAFQSDVEVALTGVDLPLANTEPSLAGMNVAIQADGDGKPSGEVLIRADVRVEKPLPGQTSWGSATLPSPFRILPNVRYWLVLQSLIGEAYWNATAGTSENPTLQCSRDSGLSWRAATAPNAPTILAALLRLRDKPDRFSIPVQLQIGKGPSAVRRKLDEYAPLGRIEFNFDFAEKLAEHLSKPELASPCGMGELLTNGGFDDPPHDDATRRLFGLENIAGLSQGIVDLSGGVDLSVERFITVLVSEYVGGGYDTKLLRIDCAGDDPAHTSLDEIIANTTRAVGQAIFEPVNNRYLGIASGAEIEILPWCKPELPTAWQGISGKVLRGKNPELGLLYAQLLAYSASTLDDLPIEVRHCFAASLKMLLPLTDEPAQLSQRIEVRSGCSYLLHLDYEANDFDQPLPTWQIEWLNANLDSLGIDEGEIEFKDQYVNEKTPPWRFETNVTAPLTAIQAEVRLVQQSPGSFRLYNVSFAPTLEGLANGSFALWKIDSNYNLIAPPLGWISSGLIEPLDPSTGGAKLRGGGPEEATLSQTIDVIAGEMYKVQVSAYLESPSADGVTTQRRSRAQLRWFGESGPIGAPVILPLDGHDFPLHASTGVAPEGAKQAEIRLIQPTEQGNLLVESVSFTRIDLIDVPLIFLAETPGELTLSNLRVTYDLPQLPEIGPAEAPSSGQAPGGAVRTAGMHRAAMMVQPAEAVYAVTAEIAAEPRESPLANMPATMVAGVGKQFSKILARRKPPVTTIADLAVFDPQVEIKGIPRERRLELKTAAEMILAIDIDIEPFVALMGEPVEALLALAPSELANRVGQPVARAEQLQRELRALRLLIKNNDFQNLHLSDLISGHG
ncbi:MAG TPA: choice-of-anchor R domain-containing protein [Anaerolineales bacterium]|nr:choice-of-anchor R domain-containing protein [Anaerolineales bacterium]